MSGALEGVRVTDPVVVVLPRHKKDPDVGTGVVTKVGRRWVTVHWDVTYEGYDGTFRTISYDEQFDKVDGREKDCGYGRARCAYTHTYYAELEDRAALRDRIEKAGWQRSGFGYVRTWWQTVDLDKLRTLAEAMEACS